MAGCAPATTDPGAAAPTPVASTSAPTPTATPGSTTEPAPTSTVSVPVTDTDPTSVGSDEETRPTRFALGAIDLPVLPVGVADDGMMELPESAFTIGWYEFGARPADQAGTTVLAGHVDTKAEGLGPLSALRGVDEGAEITVTAQDGTPRRYAVTDVEIISKARVPLEDIFARDGEKRLVVITCGGPYSPSTGYRDNVIATARPV